MKFTEVKKISRPRRLPNFKNCPAGNSLSDWLHSRIGLERIVISSRDKQIDLATVANASMEK